MSFTTTRAPSAANNRACSRPIPRPAPVMIATRPSSAPMEEEATGAGDLAAQEDVHVGAPLHSLPRSGIGRRRVRAPAGDLAEVQPGGFEGGLRLIERAVPRHVGDGHEVGA